MKHVLSQEPRTTSSQPSPTLCLPPSHHHGQNNTYPTFAGSATTLMWWWLRQSPNMEQDRENPVHLCFAAGCPTRSRSSQPTALDLPSAGTFISAGLKQNNDAKSGSDAGELICLPYSLLFQGEDQNKLTSGCNSLPCWFVMSFFHSPSFPY